MISGHDIKLSWVPDPMALHDRLLKKWPDLRMEALDKECFYYEDEQAKADWVHFGAGGRRTKHKMVHALWNRPGECWIVVDDPKHVVSQWVIQWTRPTQVGDKLDVWDAHGKVRTVTVTNVTQRSFQTDDGIRWSLRGMTPWAFKQPLRAVPLRYNPDSHKWEDIP
jgi:hypothetical protein